MIQPVRLQLSRRRGFNLQEHSRAINGLGAINCARPSLWSNPFVIGEPSGWQFYDGGDTKPLIASMSRETVIWLYESMVSGVLSPEMHPAGHAWAKRFNEKMHRTHPAEAMHRLRGHNLACWCKPSDACHCDVLLELANG